MGDESNRIDGRTVRFRERRPQLLAAVTEYVLDHGVLGLSLRPLAAGVGVTHATLLRHFESKEQLLAEVAEHLRENFAKHLDNAPGLADVTSVGDLARALWRTLCDPSQQRQFLLLFELAGWRAGAGLDPRSLSSPLVHTWVAMLGERLAKQGWNDADAIARATLFLAQARGLQLDLLITGERDRVDTAFEVSLELLTLTHSAPPTPPRVDFR
ncbi:TetR/AcrR family transcriptional regulator [Rhodococcus erythropolis]|nr:TetR/AcrR family transcriptional regulator [Rhodococcus erythropolis]